MNQISCLHGKLSKNITKTFIKFRKEISKNPINLLKSPITYLNHFLYLPKQNTSNKYLKELEKKAKGKRILNKSPKYINI